MFSLLSCVKTFKEIEIFVEQYCVNCKGIEKKYIYIGLFWWDSGYLEYWISGCILSIHGADHYCFWKLGDKNFSKTNNFFSVSLSVKTFFFWCHLPADNFFHACKKFSWAIFAFANKFFRIPPALNLYDLPMVYNALIFLTWINELKP